MVTSWAGTEGRLFPRRVAIGAGAEARAYVDWLRLGRARRPGAAQKSDGPARPLRLGLDYFTMIRN
jgi:hypothetical protein